MTAWDEIPDDLLDMRRRTLYQVFSPSAPVDRREVFAGRSAQLLTLREVVFQRGQHAVIYGERGVGKTSLAKVSREVASADRMFTAHVTCDSTDDFASIWTKVLSEVHILNGDGGTGTASQLYDGSHITPNDVRVVFRQLTQAAPAVIFVDEFDVVADPAARRSMAETVKILSDQGVDATCVLVGVADNVTDLISEHESTNRNLIQVPMPRMVMDERMEIIQRGIDTAEMTIEEAASLRIALLSQGLPQFVHLLAQRAALVALDSRRTHVSKEDVERAISIALQDTHVSVSSAYYDAVRSNRETLYPSIMLACALAIPDDRGFFTAKALVESLSRIKETRYEIPAFGPHLDRLATERGPVLIKDGEKRKFRYRFRNPLMQPYTLMKGISDGVIDFSSIER